MATTVAAYAAPAPNAPLERTTIERRAVGANDVLIEIKYSGICHSDIHQVRDEWRPGTFPMVPGHEIAGVVTEVGPEVTRYAIGDTVGVGCYVDSCRACASCLTGDEQYCLNGATFTYNSAGKDGEPMYGGYSTHIVVGEDYVLRIPDSLDLAKAAPLLCAGITMYAPLKQWDAAPGKKVAIVGLGGLGHMGVKIANAMGAEVTVLSQSLSKKADGEAMGASQYFATSDPSTFETLAGTFDLIINTVSAVIDLDAFLGLLKVGGAMVCVGLPDQPSSIGMGPLISGRRILAGSMIGGIRETQEMLDFCAEHGLGADIELIGVEQINEAYERVLASKVRYRAVIDIATFNS